MELLVDRRNLASLSFLYKLINGQIDCPYLMSKLNLTVPRIGSRSESFFYTAFCRTNVLSKSPVVHMCAVYNKICQLCDINFDDIKAILNTYKETYIN